VELWVSDEIFGGLQAARASYNASLGDQFGKLLTISDAGRIAWQEHLTRHGFIARPQPAQSQPQPAPMQQSPFAEQPMRATANGR